MFRDMVIEANGKSCPAGTLETLVPFRRKVSADKYYAWASYPNSKDVSRDTVGLFYFTSDMAKWYRFDTFVRVELHATSLQEEEQVYNEVVTVVKFRDDKKSTERVVWIICAPKERAE